MYWRLIVCILILSLFANNSYGQDNLDVVRAKFHHVQDEEDLIEVINLSSKSNSQSTEGNILQAYYAASIARQADYTIFPHKKLQYFNKGKNLLETSIEQIPTLESVYLRLVLQLKSPKMLNYYHDITNDILFIAENLPKSDLLPYSKKLFMETLLSSTDDKKLRHTISAIALY